MLVQLGCSRRMPPCGAAAAPPYRPRTLPSHRRTHLRTHRRPWTGCGTVCSCGPRWQAFWNGLSVPLSTGQTPGPPDSSAHPMPATPSSCMAFEPDCLPHTQADQELPDWEPAQGWVDIDPRRAMLLHWGVCGGRPLRLTQAMVRALTKHQVQVRPLPAASHCTPPARRRAAAARLWALAPGQRPGLAARLLLLLLRMRLRCDARQRHERVKQHTSSAQCTPGAAEQHAAACIPAQAEVKDPLQMLRSSSISRLQRSVAPVCEAEPLSCWRAGALQRLCRGCCPADRGVRLGPEQPGRPAARGALLLCHPPACCRCAATACALQPARRCAAAAALCIWQPAQAL